MKNKLNDLQNWLHETVRVLGKTFNLKGSDLKGDAMIAEIERTITMLEIAESAMCSTKLYLKALGALKLEGAA